VIAKTVGDAPRLPATTVGGPARRTHLANVGWARHGRFSSWRTRGVQKMTSCCRTVLGSGANFARLLALLLIVTSSTNIWAADSQGTPIAVYKLPTCSCCGTWVKYLEANGFVVEITDVPDMAPVRARFGVPEAIAGCHTATIGGYVVDGHVSVDEIRRLLKDRPAIKGLVVTGMPPGSPGMEAPSAGPYDVLALQQDGTTQVFATHEFTAIKEPAADEPPTLTPADSSPTVEGVATPRGSESEAQSR
jgi:hypothetical protein